MMVTALLALVAIVVVWCLVVLIEIRNELIKIRGGIKVLDGEPFSGSLYEIEQLLRLISWKVGSDKSRNE
jgi:hypothetical protein